MTLEENIRPEGICEEDTCAHIHCLLWHNTQAVKFLTDVNIALLNGMQEEFDEDHVCEECTEYLEELEGEEENN